MSKINLKNFLEDVQDVILMEIKSGSRNGKFFINEESIEWHLKSNSVHMKCSFKSGNEIQCDFQKE